MALVLIQSTEAFWPYYGIYSPWLWGKRSADHKDHDIMKRTECVFVKETSMINCHGDDGKHKECKVESIWEESEYQIFGIGISETEPLDEKYRLIPRKIDNSAWLEDFEIIDDKERHYSLYHKEAIKDLGLRVVDKTCFNELVDLLKMSSRKERIFIHSDKPNKTAVIIGEVIMTDKIPENNDKAKRYWPYYGWGGYGGYGWGGYGWGGYGWYGKRSIDKEEDKNHMSPYEMEKEIYKLRRDLDDSLELSDRYAHDFSKEYKKLKNDVQMLIEDSHNEISPKNRRDRKSVV